MTYTKHINNHINQVERDQQKGIYAKYDHDSQKAILQHIRLKNQNRSNQFKKKSNPMIGFYISVAALLALMVLTKVLRNSELHVNGKEVRGGR